MSDIPWTQERAKLWGVNTLSQAEGLLSEPPGGHNNGRRRAVEVPKTDAPLTTFALWAPLYTDLETTGEGSSPYRLQASFPEEGWSVTTGTHADYVGRYRAYVGSEFELILRYRRAAGRTLFRCTYCGASARSRDLQKLLKWWRIHC
jgi:hypothetical protein